MDTVNSSNSVTSISDSILETSKPLFSFGDSNSITETGTGFFDKFKNINITTWLLIILILAFLGFNIFVYLAKGTQDITNFFSPLMGKLAGLVANVTGQTIDVTAEGAKAVVSGTANTINTGLTDIQHITPTEVSARSSLPTQPIQQPGTVANTTLNKALNSAQTQQPNGTGNGDGEYQANEAHSSMKGGWCYIGEDRGFRSCAQVSANDMCMSGDIFPSQELCVNPNLRT